MLVRKRTREITDLLLHNDKSFNMGTSTHDFTSPLLSVNEGTWPGCLHSYDTTNIAEQST